MPRHLTSGRGPVAAGLVVALASIALLSQNGAAQAQEDCFPPKDSHEAHLFADLAVPLAFSTAEAPSRLAPGAVRLGLEATYFPNIDAETRTPTICRPGKGPENTDLLFAVPRPRVAVGLPAGFVLEGSWVPPVRLNGVRADLLGVSLERSIPLGRTGSLLGLRAHAAFGLIQAPVTCNDAALQDPNSECFQGTRSDDRYHPNTFGAEGVVSWPIAGGRFRPFLGGGLNILHPRFQVNFTNRFGFTDNRKVEVDLSRGAILAGATWAAVRGLAVTGEIYSSPSDAVTGRLVGSYAIWSGR